MRMLFKQVHLYVIPLLVNPSPTSNFYYYIL